MWVFTPEGFYSVVQKREDRSEGTLTIRTRNKADITTLVEKHFPEVKPFRVKASDYAWRVRVPQDQWALALARMAMEVDYSNFKDRVTETQGKARHDVYLRVWCALLALKDKPRRRRRREPDLHDFRGDYAPLFADDDDFDRWARRAGL